MIWITTQELDANFCVRRHPIAESTKERRNRDEPAIRSRHHGRIMHELFRTRAADRSAGAGAARFSCQYVEQSGHDWRYFHCAVPRWLYDAADRWPAER